MRFSLRALLLAVTAISLWLGWQYRIVHERREVRTLIAETGGVVELPLPSLAFLPLLAESAEQLPWVRRLLGDESLAEHVIYIKPQVDSRLEQRIRAAFPEASVERTE